MWPTLSTESDDLCELKRIATATGAATTIAQLCSPLAVSTGVSTGGWSPTGSAYAAIRDGRLSIVHADGRVDLDVDDLAYLTDLAWSPDGSWIHVMGNRPYLLRPDGSTFQAARFADDGSLLEARDGQRPGRRLDLGARAGLGAVRVRDCLHPIR